MKMTETVCKRENCGWARHPDPRFVDLPDSLWAKWDELGRTKELLGHQIGHTLRDIAEGLYNGLRWISRIGL